ncbi:hypothetical protein [Micromonospora sp. CPCC 206061]|uniref:hypothetical protein n=1 Tax=Micromonospora sp. CPCC 206061 TaxID=3122410 RepID=UPI002FEFC95F
MPKSRRLRSVAGFGTVKRQAKAPKEHFAGLEKPAHRSDRRRVRIKQPDLEAIPHRHATGLGVEVRREQEAVGIRQDDHAVTVEVRTTGGVRELSAWWSTWWTRRSCGQDSTTSRTACTCTGSE